MEVRSPGTSTFVKLVSKPQKSNTELCIICQMVRNSNQNTQLSSTHEGRHVVTKISKILSGDKLT